jgi:hypothetical protein
LIESAAASLPLLSVLPRLRCGSTCHRATGKHWQGWNNALNQFNAGVPLQSLMALPGHVSAIMSLRYGRLFDGPGKPNTRALTAVKDHLESLPAEPSGGRTSPPIIDDGWRTNTPQPPCQTDPD